jgi:hypothetical protein
MENKVVTKNHVNFVINRKANAKPGQSRNISEYHDTEAAKEQGNDVLFFHSIIFSLYILVVIYHAFGPSHYLSSIEPKHKPENVIVYQRREVLPHSMTTILCWTWGHGELYWLWDSFHNYSSRNSLTLLGQSYTRY